MTLSLPLGALIAHMSGADVFGLVVTVLIIAYLFMRSFAERNSSDLRGLADDRPVCGHPDRVAFPLGSYMARVYTGGRVFLSPIFAGPERFLYGLLRVDHEREQDWKQYAKSLIVFSLAGWLLLYLILRTQNAPWVPHALNPLGFHSGSWNVSFNTASSFTTNTNWQTTAARST